jgi:F-type H+-transporting ATPase subunit gamma
LKEILQNLSASLQDGDQSSAYSEQREPEKVLLVVVASNRGLCGAFNANVIKAANRTIEEQYPAQHAKGNLAVLTIGKKVTEFYKRRKSNIFETHDELYDQLSFENVSPLSERLMELFVAGVFDRIDIVYNQFKNAATQKLVREQFLPIEPIEVKEDAQNQIGVDYILEPSKEVIVQDLIPKSLKIQFYKAILDSFASEHGARMTAMHQATDNAKELLRDLNLTYNKARQASITKEILEIVSGAEALKG